MTGLLAEKRALTKQTRTRSATCASRRRALDVNIIHVKKMKLKEFLEIVYDHAELSFFNTDSSDYVLHKVKKNEVIEKYPELLEREIDYVNVHWFDDTGATLGIVLM